MRRSWMWTRWSTVGMLAVSAAGCNSLAKNDNPVLKPPPRRVSFDDSEVEKRIASASEEPDIVQASAQSPLDDDTQLFNARVVARVNGAPVFAGEVLERYGDYLRKARDKMPPDQYVQLRDAIIRRDLRSHIERRLLVERMKGSLKPEQIKMIDEHIDRLFEERIEELKQELKVSTRTELELALNERNATLEAIRDSFGTERIAMEYLFSQLEKEKPTPPTRADLVAYYQEHLEDYKVPARVKWEQIQVSVGRTVSKSGAEQKMAEARAELERGTPFAAVAKKYSDGPTASSGGVWDWTRSGSLADQQLEKLLFEIPVGQLSETYASKGTLHIVRVIDRQSEGRTPFADVQDAIEEKLRKDREKDLPKNYVEKMMREAIIETDYDYMNPVEPS